MLFQIRQHQQERPEALCRAALADYREGVFSITINTRDRRPLLGFIRVSSDEELAITKKSAARIIRLPITSSVYMCDFILNACFRSMLG